jgi:hypothetical protein
VTTGRELAARVGRIVLWLLVGMLLVRGALSLGGDRGDARPLRVPARAAAVWPDDAARGFAVQFVSAYLTHTPGDGGDEARAVAGFASGEVANELVPRFDERSPRQVVRSAVVAGSVLIAADRALVTVAATVATSRVSTRLVTVPVARDAGGGLVVYDLPSLAPVPARAVAARPEEEALVGSERAPITDVLTRFFRAYLAGDAGGLEYPISPGTRMRAATGGFELVEVMSIAAAANRGLGRDRLVLVTVQARDVASHAIYTLGFRVRLVRRDRWYVAAVNGPATAGGRP